MIVKRATDGKLMKYKQITVEEFVLISNLNSLVKELILKTNKDLYFNPKDQDYPIYKISIGIDDNSTFKDLELSCQRAEAQVSRWDKDWENCGLPVEILKVLKL